MQSSVFIYDARRLTAVFADAEHKCMVVLRDAQSTHTVLFVGSKYLPVVGHMQAA